MTLDAELLLAIKSQRKLVRTAHKVVTGDTCDIPLRPWINGIFSYGMSKLGMPFVTSCADRDLVSSEK